MTQSALKDIPIGRFAPSPTGALHLGNARTFLIAWLNIRSKGGKIIMRIEDLDHPKVKPWAVQSALEDMRWLGLDWDSLDGEDYFVQSERKTFYKDALETLKRKNLVYPCICSRSDVENVQSAPHRDEHRLVYSGTCRDRFSSWDEACGVIASENRIPVWRFKLDKELDLSFEDCFNGVVSVNADDVGDFAIARDEGGAGYTLAVVVDDYLMGVTEVVRGDDLLGATHSHVALQKSLGYNTPQYIHVPLVVAGDGRRLAKRHGDTRIATLRESGVSAEKILGVLAWWCGWAEFGEELSAKEILKRFSLDSLNRKQVVLSENVKRYLGVR